MERDRARLSLSRPGVRWRPLVQAVFPRQPAVFAGSYRAPPAGFEPAHTAPEWMFVYVPDLRKRCSADGLGRVWAVLAVGTGLRQYAGRSLASARSAQQHPRGYLDEAGCPGLWPRNALARVRVAARAVQVLRQMVVKIIASSLKDGKPYHAEIGGHRVTAVVRASSASGAYLAITRRRP